MTRNLAVRKSHILPWENVDLWFQFGARSPTIMSETRSHLGNVGLRKGIRKVLLVEI